MKEISIVEAKNNFADMINEIAFGKEEYILTRHGKDVAAIISIDKFKYLKKLNKIHKLVD